MEHYNAVVRVLSKGQGRYVPFLEMDARNDEVLWQLWIEGFAEAMQLRPECWAQIAESGDEGAAEALAGMITLAQIARDESDLTRDAIRCADERGAGPHPALGRAAQRVAAEALCASSRDRATTRGEGRPQRSVPVRVGKEVQEVLRAELRPEHARMRAVLGIDAAWTATQPSGIALAVEEAGGWRLIAAAASYGRFLQLADGTVPDTSRPIGSIPNAATLLTAASRLGGRPVDVVAIDMPMARTPIVSRRPADDAVSRAYGARKCSTHSPSVVRPGPISDDLRAGFEAAGYPLRADAIGARGLIEVYPHPALVELAGAAERLPYKAGKVATYWKDAAPSERRRRLLEQWCTIVALLDREMAGVSAALPPLAAGASGVEMKAYEDRIDATVCAWIGITALTGRATAYGDADAAIWIPMPRAVTNEA